jgi:hypothetical protein
VAAPLAGLALPIEESALLLVETFQGRTGATAFPGELVIVVASAEERGAVAPFLKNGAR